MSKKAKSDRSARLLSSSTLVTITISVRPPSSRRRGGQRCPQWTGPRCRPGSAAAGSTAAGTTRVGGAAATLHRDGVAALLPHRADRRTRCDSRPGSGWRTNCRKMSMSGRSSKTATARQPAVSIREIEHGSPSWSVGNRANLVNRDSGQGGFGGKSTSQRTSPDRREDSHD